MLECDLLTENFLERITEGSKLLLFPRLILVADRASWGPCDDAGIWGPLEILWKPLDPQALYTKVCQLLASEGTR